ncbi:MAG: DUF4335 domain-containing protein [Pseudanabaenaceae cyanobacterium bins.39]|nr:DUF4335 domain-containing protein [Pseudanabaenaceae cyanobacterium bins.39]
MIKRRYELPTCSLEVWAERSPLSAWQSQIVAQNLRFRLRIGLTQGLRTIKGNQQQIASLIESVTTYCDRWLQQEYIDRLEHTINIPHHSQLQLSTLQLFDLQESLELCSRDLVILPELIIEVRPLNLNWLKLVAAAIAILGASIGAIHLGSREQPSLQIASTPEPPAPEIAPPVVSGDRAIPSLPSSPPKTSTTQRQNIQLHSQPDASSPSNNQPTQAQPPSITKAPAPLPQLTKPEPSLELNPEINPPAPKVVPETMQAPSPSPDAATSEASRSFGNSTMSNDSSAISGATASPAPSGNAANRTTASKLSTAAPQIQEQPEQTVSVRISIQPQLPNSSQVSLQKYIKDFLQQSPLKGYSSISMDLEILGDRIIAVKIIEAIGDRPSSPSADSQISQLQQALIQWRSPISLSRTQVRLNIRN